MTLLILFLYLTAAFSITYDASISQRLQSYQIITHCTESQIKSWSCSKCKELEGLEDLSYIQNKASSIMAFAGYHKTLDQILIFFRGTTNIENWLENFSYYLLPYQRCSNCKVHEGFYLSYLSISDAVNAEVEKYQKKYPNKKLRIVGSSLGGALAAIAAIELQSKYQIVEELHTYGCPRVGNQQFSMFIKTRISSVIRVVHNKDIVPHVPLQSQHFHHFPFEILFDEEMRTYKICNQGGQDPSCSNAYFPNFSVQDHITYWQKLDVKQICG